MFALMDTSEGALVLGMWVEGEDDVGYRKHQGILDTSLEAHPLLGMGVLIKEAINVLCT